jgi:hypothetical protein
MGLFRKEQIMLILDKYDYKAGDKVTGKVQLNLKKPTRARKLEVGLIGKRIDKQSSMALGPMIMSGGKEHSSQSQHSIIYDFKIPLDGEKEYNTGDYSFEIKIPENINQNNPTLEGNIGKAAGALKLLSGLSSKIDWIVLAELDVPMKLDINKSQKIVIS